MAKTLQEGFHVSVVDSDGMDGPVAGPFPTLVEAVLAMIDINPKNEDGRRLALEVFYADEDENAFVRWKNRWAFEEDDGTVDPRYPLPDILKKDANG